MPTPTIDRKARMALPDQQVPKQDPLARRQNWDEVSLGYTVALAQAEASRCLQCPAAPCVRACPLHNDIPGALGLLESGDPVAAATRFRRTSPMPEVCGRVCPQERLCEGACVLGKRGAPLHIGMVERFVADAQRERVGLPPIMSGPPAGRSVAVIGAGPAGLAAAEELRRQGHRVVVFDAWPEPGGLLRYGIPSFKLPKRVVVEKVAQLEAGGVEFRCSHRVEGPGALAALRSGGFDAVLLAIGAGAARRLGVPGESLNGVHLATEFLVRANLPPDDLPPELRTRLSVGNRVVVIGGGDTAMDCARSAVRLGARDVRCLYRRSEVEMPGRREERVYAQEEGVRFAFLAAPVRLLGASRRVVAVECVRMALGEPDASGRRSIRPLPESTFVVPADTVVIAAGYAVDDDLATAAPELVRRSDGTVQADPETGGTPLPGVFAAGDVANGPDLVVTALAAGLRAAAAIHTYLTRTPSEVSGRG